MVARRFWAHKDWVKSRTAYKNNRDIKPDVMYIGQEKDDETTPNDGYDDTLQYCELWEMFFGQSKELPDGKYVIYSKHQDKILYEWEGRIFKSMRIPIIELFQFKPRTGQYATPISARSLNPMLEHEFYESDILNSINQSRSLIPLNSTEASDSLTSVLEDDSAMFKKVLVVGADDMGGNVMDGIGHIEIKLTPQVPRWGVQGR